MMQEENTAKRQSQSMAMLQKLIRVDSKDCNFHFRDLSRKYLHFFDRMQRSILSHSLIKQTNIDNHSNEALLRQFWHHIYAHYFKKIQPEEMKRLQYLQSIFCQDKIDIQTSNSSPQSFSTKYQDLFEDMNEVLNPNYMQKLTNELKSDRESLLWIKSLNLQKISLELGQKMQKESKRKTKIIWSKLKQNRRRRQFLKNKKAINSALKQDEHELDAFISELTLLKKQNMSQIDKKIESLEKRVKEFHQDLAEMVKNLEQKIKEQNYECQSRTYSKNLIYATSEKNHNSLKDLQCLQYQIKSLEQKQIAESVAKIISTERSNGEIMFQVSYQKAINLEPKLITQKQLQRINFLRQTSLVQFYRTGVKSLYSYICHNYVGFRELMQNRNNITARMKDKDMIQMIKKGACLASICEIQQQMSKFNICHHCKFLFQDHMLFTCKFTSDKQTIPKMNIEASCDPNLTEAFQQGPNRNRTSQRFMTRKKNCLTSYAKIHDQYVCGRKYCFSCLKDTYSHQNIKENGLCPFCIGVCMCTRCLRNEKIAKFKNMYTILGGDLTKVQENSDLQQLQSKNDDQIQRGRGRPKKYTISHIAINLTQKKLRRFQEKDNYASSSLLIGNKLKRKAHLYNHWKKIDSLGTQTQQQFEVKSKVKRRVGRPRLNKSGRADKKKKLLLVYS